MKKLTLWMIITLILIYPSLAVLCKDVDYLQNCTITTPSLMCSNYNYTIQNVSNGAVLDQKPLTLINNSIYSLTYTMPKGDYYIFLCDGTTMEVGGVQGDKSMTLGIITIIPLILGLILLISCFILPDVTPYVQMKLGFILLSFFSIFTSYHYGILILVKYYDFPELQDAIASASFWFGGILVVVFALLFINMIWRFYNYYTGNNEDEEEGYGL